MSKIIFTYEADGKFEEAVTLRLEKNGDITISVSGAARIDGSYREPGEFANMRLPSSRVQTLAEAILTAIPREPIRP